jgi:hypothetical protein
MQDIQNIRMMSVYNHVYIGMIIEAMQQTENQSIKDATARLMQIRSSLSKQQQIQEA